MTRGPGELKEPLRSERSLVTNLSGWSLIGIILQELHSQNKLVESIGKLSHQRIPEEGKCYYDFKKKRTVVKATGKLR